MSDININQNEQAREAERAVLGGLMLETQRFDTVIQVIKENDFDGKDHQIIFQSMSELIEENKPLDPLTVSEKLDNNKNLIGFENGVFDLIKYEFRDGRPEDCISLSTKTDYIEYEEDCNEIKEIYLPPPRLLRVLVP